jgi:hypothetical protein
MREPESVLSKVNAGAGAGLKEMVRVTKPGGRVLLVVPDANSKGQPGTAALALWSEVSISLDHTLPFLQQLRLTAVDSSVQCKALTPITIVSPCLCLSEVVSSTKQKCRSFCSIISCMHTS